MDSTNRPLYGLALTGLTLWLCAACVDPQVRRGRDALGQGRYTEALVTLRAVHARQDDTLPDVSMELASACRARANELLNLGACGSASELIYEADKHTHPVLSDHRALYRCIESHPTKAADRLQILKRLVNMGERQGQVLKALVRMVIDAGDRDSVMKYGPMALARFALEPRDTRAIGFIFAASNRPEEAMTFFWHFMQADTSDPLVRLKVAELQIRTGDMHSARQSYDALVRDFPNHPVVHLRLANFCTQQRDLDCARAATIRANQLRGVKRLDRELRPLLKSRR